MASGKYCTCSASNVCKCNTYLSIVSCSAKRVFPIRVDTMSPPKIVLGPRSLEANSWYVIEWSVKVHLHRVRLIFLLLYYCREMYKDLWRFNGYSWKQRYLYYLFVHYWIVVEMDSLQTHFVLFHALLLLISLVLLIKFAIRYNMQIA